MASQNIANNNSDFVNRLFQIKQQQESEKNNTVKAQTSKEAPNKTNSESKIVPYSVCLATIAIGTILIQAMALGKKTSIQNIEKTQRIYGEMINKTNDIIIELQQRMNSDADAFCDIEKTINSLQEEALKLKSSVLVPLNKDNKDSLDKIAKQIEQLTLIANEASGKQNIKEVKLAIQNLQKIFESFSSDSNKALESLNKSYANIAQKQHEQGKIIDQIPESLGTVIDSQKQQKQIMKEVQTVSGEILSKQEGQALKIEDIEKKAAGVIEQQASQQKQIHSTYENLVEEQIKQSQMMQKYIEAQNDIIESQKDIVKNQGMLDKKILNAFSKKTTGDITVSKIADETFKLSDVKFEKGVAKTASDTLFNGKIKDTLKSGDIIELEYKEGKLVGAKKTDKNGVNIIEKTYEYLKEQKEKYDVDIKNVTVESKGANKLIYSDRRSKSRLNPNASTIRCFAICEENSRAKTKVQKVLFNDFKNGFILYDDKSPLGARIVQKTEDNKKNVNFLDVNLEKVFKGKDSNGNSFFAIKKPIL